MENYMDYPVGTIIEFDDKIYKVIESDSCDNCAFKHETKQACMATGKQRKWFCSRFAREDFKDVIFRLIEKDCNK